MRRQSLAPAPFHRSANLCWLDDRAWFLATDIDLMSSYVGGSEALVDAAVSHPSLEASRVAPTEGISIDADTLNRAE